MNLLICLNKYNTKYEHLIKFEDICSLFLFAVVAVVFLLLFFVTSVNY